MIAMTQPLFNLFVFAMLSLAGVVLFWPRNGLLSRLRRQRHLEGRVKLEDALKHTYHQEYHGQTASVASLGGSLEVSAMESMAIIERMQHSGLAAFTDGRILLTVEGKRYALQIVRAHRLWERYLADETGVAPVRWHAEAERREHTMSPEDTDALAARLGDPRFDPHGDPIPTADGTVPERNVANLSELESGERARIVHIEDEPDAVYAQLVALGLYPGMGIRVNSRSEQRLVCEADGREIVLAPIVAHNVSVQHVESDVDTQPDLVGQYRSLARLELGESAEVVRLSPACRGIERRRLMDLGIIPGTKIEFERRGLTGGLSAYRVRDTLIALRAEQAEMISIGEIAEVSA